MLLFTGVHSIQAQRLRIVTTLPSLASITEHVGGGHVVVNSITRGSQDAHYIEAKPSYMMQLHRADLLIYSGLELEIGWLPLLIQGARNQKVAVGSIGHLNASAALSEENVVQKPRGEVDRSMGDVHPLGNPHYLLNPYHGLKVADLIAEKLIQLDPSHEQRYQQNLEDFRRTLQSRISDWERRASGLAGLEVVCYHPHWTYTLDWLGIINTGYIELRPGIPPSPKHKMAMTQLMQQRDIRIVIISSWKEPSKAEEVAKASDATLVILPGEVRALGESEDYITWIDYVVSELVKTASGVVTPGRHRHRRQQRGTL